MPTNTQELFEMYVDNERWIIWEASSSIDAALAVLHEWAGRYAKDNGLEYKE